MSIISRIRHLIPSYAVFPLFLTLMWNQAVYYGDYYQACEPPFSYLRTTLFSI
ncbi:hypothetical protein AALB16_16385 [Lachnospiraceae bacterium 62-35]